jgi:redox-sensing transcriptional repressor
LSASDIFLIGEVNTLKITNKKGKQFRVPDATIRRLPLYLDKLILLQQAGVREVSSRQLAMSLDIKASQLRHDFHYFGGFSKPGRPYDVDQLVPALEEIIGVDNPVPFVVVGAGHLGQALCNYANFERQGFPLVGIFDNDPDLIGIKIRGIKIEPIENIATVIKKKNVRLAAITVPSLVAQETAVKLVDAGVRGIWNYTPVDLRLPKDIIVRNERLATGLMCLSFKTKRLEHPELISDD